MQCVVIAKKFLHSIYQSEGSIFVLNNELTKKDSPRPAPVLILS